MDKLSYGKWGSWIATVGVLLCFLAAITAQPGFLSISCGVQKNATAENNITWVTDAHYIDVGETADIGDASEQTYGSYLHTMRSFPKPLNKSCYQLPVAPDVPHLLRLWFAKGNFSRYPLFSYQFAFSIETVDMLASRNVTVIENESSFYENILVTKGRVLYICLVRTSPTDDPFISAIEIRKLQHGMYRDAQPGTIFFTVSRYDAGGNSMVRYPHDNFDRIWTPIDTSISEDTSCYYKNVTSKRPISTNNTKDFPPTAVLQTAWVTDISDASIPLQTAYFNTQMLTEKSDLHSFGVVLLEILSGRAPIDTNLPEEEINIVRWVTPYLLETDENGGKIIDVIDQRLCGGYDMKSVSNVAKIAMRCVQALPSRRPTVSEVVAELKEAIKVEEDKDCISIAEENGIQNGDVSTKREGMEWSDDSCNMSNVGR